MAICLLYSSAAPELLYILDPLVVRAVSSGTILLNLIIHAVDDNEMTHFSETMLDHNKLWARGTVRKLYVVCVTDSY